MPRLVLTLLGGFEARLADGPVLTFPTRKVEGLLAYLALPPGQAHPRDKLAALLWGEAPQVQARASLRQALFTLRRALAASEPAPLCLDGPAVALDLAAVEVDVATFEARSSEGTPVGLEAAARLYRGDLLAGLDVGEAPFEEWLLAERERVRELALEALAKLLSHQRRVGALEAAVQTGLRLVALEPLQEAVHRTLMRLYAELGRRGAALRQYQACVAALQRELRVEPEAETEALHREILHRRPGAAADVATDPAPAPVSLPTGDTPLVGRQLERARLDEALSAAWQGSGQVVVIRGEAGIGKTRLVTQLHARALEKGARVLLGRAYETEQTLPFGPWLGALRGAGVARDAALLDTVGRVWRAQLARLLPEVGPAPPPAATGADTLHLFECVARLIAALAARQPLLLVLEDLHWADDTSLRLLAFVARRVPARAVLLVATAREEEPETPALATTLHALARDAAPMTLRLGPLSREDTLELVGALAASGVPASPDLGERVWATATGHPLMIVETMRALATGGWQAGAPGLALPERVRELIGRRLSRLGEQARRLAAVAAVIAREFDPALLQRAAGVGAQEAADAVDELLRHRVLHTAAERLSFTHDRIRDVAFEQLSPPRRRLLHRQVAEAIEARYGPHLEPHAPALGLHYREAEAWEEAVRYLRQAGGAAAARSAYREAMTCFDQALAGLVHLCERPDTSATAIDLRLDASAALLALGELTRLVETLTVAEADARGIGDKGRLGRAWSCLSQYHRLIGDPERAIDFGRRALGVAGAVGDRALEVTTNYRLGQAYRSRGEYRQAVTVLTRNVVLLDGERPAPGTPSRPLDEAVLSRFQLAIARAELGEMSQAVADGEEALRLAEATERPDLISAARNGLGCALLDKGELDSAIAALEDACRLARQWELGVLLYWSQAPLAQAYALAGRVAEAVPLQESTVAQAEFLRHSQSRRVTMLGEAYLLAGSLVPALDAARRALELARQYGERGQEAWALRLLGEIATESAPPDCESEGWYRQALALADDCGMRPLIARCHLGLGQLFQRVGARSEAKGHLGVAATMFREMDMRFWLARAEAAGG